MTHAETIRSLIVDVPDFPMPGILFKDVTPLAADPRGLSAVVAAFRERYEGNGIQRIVAIESRGFVFGAPLAYALGVGLVLVRKPGKLPRKASSVTYSLEYGTDTLAMHEDALAPGERVIVLDDVLATGGTAAATAQLVEQVGARVEELAFVMELGFLDGRRKLAGRSVYSIVSY